MAEDGIAAEPKIMIENTIHKFSYLFYKKLKEFDIVIGESKRVDWGSWSRRLRFSFYALISFQYIYLSSFLSTEALCEGGYYYL